MEGVGEKKGVGTIATFSSIMAASGGAQVIPLATFHPRVTDEGRAEDWVEVHDTPWLAEGPPPGVPMDFQQVQDRLQLMADEEAASEHTGLTVRFLLPPSEDSGAGPTDTSRRIPLHAPEEDSVILPNFLPLLQQQAAEVAERGGKPKWTKWLANRQQAKLAPLQQKKLKMEKWLKDCPYAFHAVRGLSDAQLLEILALLKTMDPDLQNNVHAVGPGCKEVGRALVSTLPHPEVVRKEDMMTDDKTPSLGCWMITWMPGAFRKDGTDVHTVPGVPFFILTICPDHDVMYPGPGPAGTSSTLIGVYIDPCTQVRSLLVNPTPIQIPDRLVSDKLAQDKVVERLISQSAGGSRVNRLEDFKVKGRTATTEMYFLEDGDKLTEVHAALCFALEDAIIHAWHQDGTCGPLRINFRWNHLAFENAIRNLEEMCPRHRLLLLQAQWLGRQHGDDSQPVTILPKDWLELGPAVSDEDLAHEAFPVVYWVTGRGRFRHIQVVFTLLHIASTDPVPVVTASSPEDDQIQVEGLPDFCAHDTQRLREYLNSEAGNTWLAALTD